MPPQCIQLAAWSSAWQIAVVVRLEESTSAGRYSPVLSCRQQAAEHTKQEYTNCSLLLEKEAALPTTKTERLFVQSQRFLPKFVCTSGALTDGELQTVRFSERQTIDREHRKADRNWQPTVAAQGQLSI